MMGLGNVPECEHIGLIFKTLNANTEKLPRQDIESYLVPQQQTTSGPATQRNTSVSSEPLVNVRT